MNIVLCDITGRTINYDVELCEAIRKELDANDKFEFWCAGLTEKYDFKTHNFLSIVPDKYRSISHPVTKCLKAFETIFAYTWILAKVLLNKVDVLHLQWFPFISLGVTGASIDILFIRILKCISPKTKLVFTIHNMCPHSMKEEERANYNPTYSKILKLFDEFIVHTEQTKHEVIDVLKLDKEKVSVIYHGIFKPKDYTFKQINTDSDNLNIIMYGFQNPYKGTDVLTKSLKYLTENTKKRINVKICGVISEEYRKECSITDSQINIKWIPKFLSDQELNKEIDSSDLIILPYRRISQSGVLLLALSTRRLILTSNLPTFKETLKGFPDDAFFESENPEDLARVIENYITGKISKKNILSSIESLNSLYSWEESGKKTINIYKK